MKNLTIIASILFYTVASAQNISGPLFYQGKKISNKDQYIDCRVVLLSQGSFLLNNYVDVFRFGKSYLAVSNDRKSYNFTGISKKTANLIYENKYGSPQYGGQLGYRFSIKPIQKPFGGDLMIGEGSSVSVNLPDGKTEKLELNRNSQSLKIKIDLKDSGLAATFGEVLEASLGCNVMSYVDSLLGQRKID